MIRHLTRYQRALRDARKASRTDRLDRAIPVLDRDFDEGIYA